MDAVTHLAELDKAVSAMTRVLAEADPEASVPTCPGWSVLDLADHLGCAHLWAAEAARHGTRPQPYPLRVQGERSLSRWYADCGAELVTTLRAMDPQAPAWTFMRDDRTTSFWRRRQMHETLIHWADALLASGRGPGIPDISAEIAVDGVDEVLTRFLVRAAARAASPSDVALAPAPITLRASDVEAAWTVTSSPELVVTRSADPAAAAQISAPAALLYLALWKRADRDQLTLAGDEAAARAFLGAQLVP